MIEETGNKEEELPKEVKSDEDTGTTKNDGLNTPVDKQTNSHTPSEKEKDTYKQAENPLGNPDRD